jgi:hypothetical protein
MQQEFKNIIEWLIFIINSSDKELIDFIGEDFVLDGKINEHVDIDDDKLIINFQTRLQGNMFENLLWEVTLYYYPDKLPDYICHYLMDNEIALSTLGHTKQSDEIMWVLGKLVPEAALTLGQEIFMNDVYTANDVKQLLDTFYNDHWLWNSLIYLEASGFEKQEIFNKRLASRNDFDAIKERKEELTVEILLKQTKSVELIRKYFLQKNPRYYQVIAQNIHSPIDVLEELQSVKDIKFARNIRNYATENIRVQNKY